MREVGFHLGSHANLLRASSESSADLFARSAFNRLYYAAYLTTRDRLSPHFSSFPRNHSGVPDFLEALGKGKIAEIKRKARRMDDHQLQQDCSAARIAANSLAILLSQSYAVRVFADYHPNVLVEFHKSDAFTLNSVGFENAKKWPQMAELWCDSIIRVVLQA